jgi:hypothetical protein
MRVHLTNPLGGLIEVNPDQIAEVRPATAGVDAPGAKSVIVLESGATQAVRETEAEIDAKTGNV